MNRQCPCFDQLVRTATVVDKLQREREREIDRATQIPRHVQTNAEWVGWRRILFEQPNLHAISENSDRSPNIEVDACCGLSDSIGYISADDQRPRLPAFAGLIEPDRGAFQRLCTDKPRVTQSGCACHGDNSRTPSLDSHNGPRNRCCGQPENDIGRYQDRRTPLDPCEHCSSLADQRSDGSCLPGVSNPV